MTGCFLLPSESAPNSGGLKYHKMQSGTSPGFVGELFHLTCFGLLCIVVEGGLLTSIIL